MELDKQFNGVCRRFTTVQLKYGEMVEAFKAFCDKKHELAALLMPHDPDDDGRDAAGEAREYPSKEDKASILEAVRRIPTKDLATMLRSSKLDLGALGDEDRMVFIARATLDEAANRLSPELRVEDEEGK